MPLPWISSANLITISPKPRFPLSTDPSCSSSAQPQRAQRLMYLVAKCTASSSESGKAELKIGSPIVIVEAPLVVKTATPMPSLRANNGQVKAGDVGRVVARKPKDVWAIRLAIGTYLLDGKYFRPFDEED